MKLHSSNHLHSRSRANVLLLTVFTVMGIGIVLFSCLGLVRSQNVYVFRAQAWHTCIPTLEAGIEEAMAHLNNPLDTNMLSDGWSWSNGTYMQQRQFGENWYSVNITMTNRLQPVIVCTGYVPIPMVALPVAAGAPFPSDADLQSQYLSRTVRVIARKTELFVKGMVAKEQITMNGNTITPDSFDSSDPNNFSDATGHYLATKIKDNGDVSTVSGLSNSVSVGNANIKGRLSTGPGGSGTVGANGSVGSLAWHAGNNTGIQSGWYFHDMNITLPSVTKPFSSAQAPIPASGNYTLGDGNYELSSLTLNSTARLTVTGNAVLLVDGNVTVGGTTAGIYITPPGSLKLYVGGANAVIGGAGVNNAGWSTNFIYYGLPTNQGLVLKSNGEFTGAIYAPDAALNLVGGGSSDQNFIGACVMKTITVNGHYNFHYDEALKRFGPPSLYVITSWLEL